VDREAQYRRLPPVDALAAELRRLEPRFPRRLIVEECRRALGAARAAIRAGEDAPRDLAARVQAALEALAQPSLKRVINATGVILHTNLGRAPLPAMPAPGWYSNLEYGIESGRRGKRDGHTAPLLERLLGAPAIVVNNNAAAVFLALNELAGDGGEAVVSRGELIEIGDGFRIPDIMARSGARLAEAGTTNRTTAGDYRDAITGRTRLLMRVHPSNFRISGFTARPELSELAALGREFNLPVYEDLGSGCLMDLGPYGIGEPLARASLEAGADLVSFSGDKLLGGPQAGIIAGRADLVTRCRRNPLFRALRVDKLTIAALETALRHWLFERWDRIPVCRMLMQTPEQLRARAEAFAAACGAEVVEGESLLGGGSTPGQALPAWLVAPRGDAVEIERRLRAADPPVIARIEKDRLLLDLRTVAPEEEPALLAILAAAV
jgi:L-seryl-tRNA(Ser) seleniumtransferase